MELKYGDVVLIGDSANSGHGRIGVVIDYVFKGYVRYLLVDEVNMLGRHLDYNIELIDSCNDGYRKWFDNYDEITQYVVAVLERA